MNGEGGIRCIRGCIGGCSNLLCYVREVDEEEGEGDRGGLFYEDVATKRGTMEEFVMEILGREKKLLRSLWCFFRASLEISFWSMKGSFIFFLFFSSLLFFFSLFDRTTMEFQLRFKRIIYFWNFSKCYENLFKILYRFGTCENTFARNNLLRLILWKIEILLAFLLTLRDTGGNVEQRHGKSWLLWIPSWGLKKARMQLTSS